MSKKEEKLELYSNELSKFTNSNDIELLSKIVDLLGPSIYNADSETVACSDKEELERVLNSTVTEKLGIAPTMEDLKAICEQMGTSNRNKYRAVFYYLLVEKIG